MQAVTEQRLALQYPAPPWTLHGQSLQALRLIEISCVRALMPRELRIVPVLPGRTLGALYCARYEPPSTLCYQEMAVAPALTYVRGRLGFWISHIYVDHPDSVAAGREVWGLPKQMAHFAFAPEKREITVSQGSQQLVQFQWDAGGVSIPAPLMLPAFGAAALPLLRHFNVTGRSAVRFQRGLISVAADSPFSSLGFDGIRTMLNAHRLTLRVPEPRTVRAVL